jgi:hypothetical protein
VLIYMAPKAQRAFLDRVATQMPALDVLILGATESLWGATERFELLTIGGGFAYRPAGAAARAERPPARPSPAAPSPPRAVPTPAPSADVCLAAGEAAMAAGDVAAAVAAFRRASYLDADGPLGHFHLGAALELAGAGSEARRAYAVALSALRRRGTAVVEVELQGFTAAELVRIIEGRLARAP